MARKRLTNGQKLQIVRDCEQRLANNESLRSIARSYGVQGVQIRQWRDKQSLLAATKSTKKSTSRGAKSRLQEYEDEIMTWAFHQREAGVPLTYKHLVVKAGQVWPEFRKLTDGQQYHTVRRLCQRKKFAVRRIIRNSSSSQTDHPNQIVSEAEGWLAVMRPIVRAPDVQQKFVLNMDQTPMFLSMYPHPSVNLQGDRTVNGRRTTDSGSRFTVTCTVSANGDKLKPYLIFKGERNGRIATQELPTNPYREQVALCCQNKAWHDGINMEDYIDRVLVPYLQQKANGVPCLLLMTNDASSRWTDDVKERLEQIGITPYKIPPGCTCLVHPLAVGIWKPFKDQVRSKWWQWMIDQGADKSTFVSASRELRTKWVSKSWEAITQVTIRNAWRKTGFSYFPQEE
ncbi:DDE superfamily endonuclease [Nitzschia inconspicua]|uniref:DDE superfamily endonuclease n=1 Tax=Nitzschia inconspicua TaxID=303405 RepID=A0A9K3LCW5_9STRA|nr:DDE superfamily endonuclease [Nitzschia inconspicua]